ncbi:hypothetical protein J6590_057353 [Homalodisca vitripennis]|nr:hypothetical protein J6590_057353 [Homalodisca vitripennis]
MASATEVDSQPLAVVAAGCDEWLGFTCGDRDRIQMAAATEIDSQPLAIVAAGCGEWLGFTCGSFEKSIADTGHFYDSSGKPQKPMTLRLARSQPGLLLHCGSPSVHGSPASRDKLSR